MLENNVVNFITPLNAIILNLTNFKNFNGVFTFRNLE